MRSITFHPKALAFIRNQSPALKQSDLPEIGSQGVVSEILSGKRELNVRQITQLATRFGVSPTLFMPVLKKSSKRPSSRRRAANRR